MKVILKEDVRSLGRMGDIVTVADGYARNFLIPKSIAVEADTKNVREFEHHRKAIATRAAKIRETMKSAAEQLSSKTVTIRAKAGEDEKLFGSVTNMDIAEALAAEGVDVDRKKIVMEEPIKRLGTYKVDVKFHSEINAQVTVNVVQE